MESLLVETFVHIKWNCRRELKQIVKKLLVFNYEISVFKLKGYTLTVKQRPELTKLLKKNWISSLRKFETQSWFKNSVIQLRVAHAWLSLASWTEINCYQLFNKPDMTIFVRSMLKMRSELVQLLYISKHWNC